MNFKELDDNRHEMNISKDSIEYILEIMRKNKLKNVLEIGCFNGYSALKFSTVASKVVSIEIDKHAIEVAKKNFEKYKVKNIKIIYGDAKYVLKELKETFDVVLIDAVKSEYRTYLISALKLVNKGGFIYADNTISHKYKMKDFFDYLENSKLNWEELGIGKGLVEIKI